MKTIRNLSAWAATCLASGTPALAAAGVREDHSGILVWAFLGLCALIVVAQLMPAVLMLIGMAKGFAHTKAPAAARETVPK